MSSIYNQFLAVGPASAVGATQDLTGTLTAWAVEVILDASANTLNGTLTFGIGVETAATYPLGNTIFLATTQAPAGWTFTGATSTLVFTNPPSGRTSMILRGAAPIRLLTPTWTYTSGGGTFTLRCIAWGAVQQ